MFGVNIVNMSIQWNSKKEEETNSANTIITTTKTSDTNMVTTVMAYHISVSYGVHHPHYQSTNGHTDTLNENITTPWCLESDYFLFNYCEGG